MLKKLAIIGLEAAVLLGALLYWLYSDAVFTANTNDKVVALSFDDGPNPGETEELLDFLAAKNITASFFIIGQHAAKHPALLQRIHNEGHELANHSWSHDFLVHPSKALMLAEIDKTNQLILEVTGQHNRLFRPPYFAIGPGLRRAIAKRDMQVVGASASASDAAPNNAALAEQFAAQILSKIEPGGIILLHDGSANNDRRGSIEATKTVVNTLTQQGYRFASVGQLLALDRP